MAKPGHSVFANPAGNSDPPPSTLAAQLVGNIPTSNRSSRPDAVVEELKRLSAIIDRVKDNPGVIETDQERIEHNHTLIYVCGGVVLDSLKWNGIFANYDQLRDSASKTINFLIVTLKETPTVLEYTADEGSFLSRGSEPLWVWILPKVLKMLGHSKSLTLTPTIECLFQQIFLFVAQTPALWAVGQLILRYLQWNMSHTMIFLKRRGLKGPDAFKDFTLPPEQLLDEHPGTINERCSYTLEDPDHAVRHLAGIITIVKNAILGQPQHITGEEDAVLAIKGVLPRALVHIANEALAYRPLSVLVASRLAPQARQVVRDSPETQETDLGRALSLLAWVACEPPPTTICSESLPSKFVDHELRQKVSKLGLKGDQPVAGPVTKRRKVAESSLAVPLVLGQLAQLAAVSAACDTGLQSLDSLLLQKFPNMAEDQQCQVFDLLSRVYCAVDGTLEVKRTASGTSTLFQCPYCSTSGVSAAQLPVKQDPDSKAAKQIFLKLIGLPSFKELRRPRVFAMIALRRAAQHARTSVFLDFEISGPGEWCLDSLKSSLRELRIAAGRTFGLFFSERTAHGVDKTVMKRKRKNALEYLRALSDKNQPHLYETCILAWGQVGRVIADDELGLVLLALVEYLGHGNTILSAAAFSEILGVAEARGLTPKKLFQPFWPSLSYSVVKDLVSKPQTASKVAELLGLPDGVQGLLRLLQQHALPWLVLHKKREVIQKVADARGEVEVYGPFLDAANLSSVMAVLLIQDAPEVEELIMSSLRHVSPEFDRLELADLLRTEPLLVPFELLKISADGDETRKAQASPPESFLKQSNRQQVRNAFGILAHLLYDKEDRKTAKKKSHLTGRFLEIHAPGLTSKLSDVVTDSPPRYSLAERRRALRAMEEMIRLCRASIGVVRTQISACILSVLDSDDLRSTAFSCWEVLMTHLVDMDVEMLVEVTFFIIGHHWESFDTESRTKTCSLIRFLLEKQRDVLAKYCYRLPSLSHIKELTELDALVRGLRPALDTRGSFGVFIERLNHENPGVIHQALIELVKFLKTDQDYLQDSAISEQPDSVVLGLARALLDCASKYNGWLQDISRLCAECIGLIGCLDSNRLETTREEKQFVLVHNFDDSGETTNFAIYLLENVLIKSFLSTTDVRFQGFLSFAMQELLDRTDFKFAILNNGAGTSKGVYEKWLSISESNREVLVPFLSTRFLLPPLPYTGPKYPIFQGGSGRTYAQWLRTLVYDLLHNDQNPFSTIIFTPLRRLVRVQDLSVAEAVLPYTVMHVIVGQENSSEFRDKIAAELASILEYQPPESASYVEREELKLHYEAVFRIIDYCMRWVQARKALPGSHHAAKTQKWVKWVEAVIAALDPELIARRAVDCKEYARALFFLEPHIEARNHAKGAEADRLMQTIQDIYTQIDDPDGLEGISAQLQSVSLDQQALNHRKAGRWTAAQTWYEIRLAESPANADIQLDLLTCLKESGQHDVLLNYVEGMKSTSSSVNRIVPYAVEASWATNRWKTLEKYLQLYSAGDVSEVFNLGVGQALLSLKEGSTNDFKEHISMLREKVAGSMTFAATSSLRASHDLMLRCHVLSDLEMIVDVPTAQDGDQQPILSALDRRLEVLGAYVSDKQYLLGVRRAAMELMRPKFGNQDISSLWLSTARLAKKSGAFHQSFNAVLHAQQLGDGSAVIENARLLYKEGHHRKAIQILQNAIETNSFINDNIVAAPPTSSRSSETQRNLLTARAHLLLAKWLDTTGQTHASALRSKYQEAAKIHSQWEKGHYYLGRHYKKVLESEKALKPDDQTDEYLSGEIAKLVIENYLRSLNFGTKYLYQTLPRILTLWLELGAQVDKPPDGKISVSRELHTRRKSILHELHKHFSKYIQKMPAYIFYTALPQIVARIAHPNLEVFRVLELMIVKIVENHPRQALWSLFSFMTTRMGGERRTRGLQILQTVRGISKRVDGVGYDLKQLLRMGEKLAEQLLLACNNGDFQSNRTTHASLKRDLNFNSGCTPCPLVVPVESCLTATLPTLTENVRKHKAFSRDVISIREFEDHVLVLGSLAKPRKLTARGSDGKMYGLLIKPKDDLRTDQRLMEFNGLINRSLKRDAESSRRQLYIRTYAVTPLNEECGIIEWVDGLKTLRDILLTLYKSRNISPNYGHITEQMKKAVTSEANLPLFTQEVLGMFPPVLPDWFISQFPNPSVWFAARLRYTRSCAVMSMVGTILGLGDRHGENVLLEEGNGGVFHVDFNCLFDKGLTFAKPERVPFRLTHNMVAAMGIYGYEGPFRHCSELTLRVLRQQEETLMTILEAFIYDPTLDLQRSKKRQEAVKLNPTSVVESIRRKVRGLLPDESIPLGVEGQVEELIKQAVNPRNLAAMYIGWCPFL
ncbi:hypothetical protein OQA88_6586 [Cercophora sp. LCS_1]